MNSELKEYLPIIAFIALLAFFGTCNNGGGHNNQPQRNVAPNGYPNYYNPNIPPPGSIPLGNSPGGSVQNPYQQYNQQQPPYQYHRQHNRGY